MENTSPSGEEADHSRVWSYGEVFRFGWMMIKAILFDFDQTLVDSVEGFRFAEREAETRIFADLELSSWEFFLSDYRKLRHKYHEESNFSRYSLWQSIYLDHGREPSEGFLEDLERQYWEIVKSKTRLFPETMMVLGKLSTKYRLALISNTQGQGASGGHRLRLYPELESFFEIVIIAGESGVPPKPDRRPFLLSLEKLGIFPSEAVFLGDDLNIDIRGAQDVGIQPIWLKHHLVHRHWPQEEISVPVINNLEQLFPLLKEMDWS